jgi:hypothetical protein
MQSPEPLKAWGFFILEQQPANFTFDILENVCYIKPHMRM